MNLESLLRQGEPFHRLSLGLCFILQIVSCKFPLLADINAAFATDGNTQATMGLLSECMVF
jgi:hypothetical protein